MVKEQVIAYLILAAPLVIGGLIFVSPVIGLAVAGLAFMYSGMAIVTFFGPLPVLGLSALTVGMAVGGAGIILLTLSAVLRAVLRKLEGLTEIIRPTRSDEEWDRRRLPPFASLRRR
jgi:hypothetical protein